MAMSLAPRLPEHSRLGNARKSPEKLKLNVENEIQWDWKA